jgi:glycosyltransferase involved in cell wall biosynthesis
MNILFVDQFSDPGGAQLALLDILDEALNRGWNSRIIAPGFGKLLQRASATGVHVDRLSLRPLTNGSKSPRDALRYLADLPRMRAEIRRSIVTHRADVLYINGPRPLPAAIGLDIPVIFHAHSLVNGAIPRALTVHALRRTRATLIAASHFAAAPFETGPHVIYNGSPDFGQHRSTDGNGITRIGMVGRISPYKGQLDFVRAVHALKAPNASFTIYGDSLYSEPDYETRVRALAAGTNIAFEPWRDDVTTIYNELDILAVPSSSNEVSTRVIMEAFSAGVAVVAYPSGGIPEVVEHERTGLLTTHADSAQLAQALHRLIVEPQIRNSLARAARAEWQQRFTRRSFQTSVCDVIEATYSNRDSILPTRAQYHRDKTQSAAHARRHSSL